ncbi:HAD-IC family P-type ATPase [Candidatus Enterococcus clewellii]|uniref:Calcium-translocating P-type ATPase, PMCA-type n=1 Tax=Candidatus Enterococcus clewellii TaxID=1834193 RepID=A0A242K292_9ENTE|nr:HAD-IC family P-type ATPase [Enterococcus sp. 9E7_DIV0242]OTP11582.1 calcium-translocating P-type ATPase, PMCA-type [Enterococcus sp. 9E7_DIV0242]
MKWHKYTADDAIQTVNSSRSGLDNESRKQKLEQDGKNVLSKKNQLKTWQKVGKHFVDLLMIVLMVAAVLKGITGSYVEMGIILAVVIINGLIGYLQERKAEESLNGLKQMMGQEAVILSGGVRKTVASEDLVVGDIVLLKSGDVVPADIRLIETHDLVIEESALTGESLPVEKQVKLLEEDTPLGDRTNMAFSGTLVQDGSGSGVIVAVGDETEIGQINSALQSVQKQTTPLIRKMNQLNKQIFKGLIGFIVFLIFFTTLRHGMDINVLLSSVIALIVAVIPEGLPAVLTMILSMGVKEMAEEKAIVKSMPAVETLGSMTVICSDKTGTLTKNEMTVVDIILPEKAEKQVAIETAELDITSIMNNCQDLKLDGSQSVHELSGNPTELALLKFVDDKEVPFLEKKDKIPFSSAYKYMATAHELSTGEEVVFVKGAPEVLLELAQLTNAEQEYWKGQAAELAQKGQRVLGFAMKHVTKKHELTHEALTGLTMTGLAGIIDPPKESAIQAVAEAQQAGIAVKMITGDHKDTAIAIGKQIGLNHTAYALEGKDIDHLSDEELKKQVKTVDIFARTTPEHKLRIVTALQQNGEVVGMTGDGVNDAPALKKADIGIAMGIKGSEVSKQAADMVLADDNFATITRAVKEGRRIFDNLKKTINFFLPTALAQGLIVIFALMTNLPLPLTPVQILWVNMVTTITLSYALGFEPANKRIMERAPRDPKAPMLSGYSIFRIFYVSLLITVPAYFIAMQAESQLVQQTMLLQSIVLAQAFYMLNCRELLDPSINKAMFKNKAIFISLACLAVLQGVVLLVPIAQQAIGLTTLTTSQHLSILLNTFGIFLIVELEKLITKKIRKKKAKEVMA